MDITTGTAVAKTAVDLVKNENVLNKSVGLMGMLCPFENLVLVHDGLKKKRNLPSIKDMSANEEHTLICEFLKDFLVEKDKELDVDISGRTPEGF